MVQDRTVHAEDIIAFLNVLAPPEVLEVAFQFRTQGTVIPASVETAVEFGGL
jgi:hypothetical protein